MLVVEVDLHGRVPKAARLLDVKLVLSGNAVRGSATQLPHASCRFTFEGKPYFIVQGRLVTPDMCAGPITSSWLAASQKAVQAALTHLPVAAVALGSLDSLIAQKQEVL